MAVFETWLRSDLKKPMRVVELSGNLFSADNGGNLIGVEVLDGGQAASLSGNVYGYVIRADGGTVLIDGTLSGNRASIVLPASAYIVIGQVSIVIKVGSTTVGACTSYVYQTTTDTIVDPGRVIPSIEELLAQIDACIAATAGATAAAANANTAASSANTAATNANTKAGQAETAAGNANTAAGKINNMTVAATTLPAGSQATVSVKEVSGHKHIIFGLPKGESGNETIDDTAGKGDIDKVWSADKTLKEVDSKADAICKTIDTPASIVTIEDGADDLPVNQIRIGIEPVQEGTGDPSPDNVRPISGWTGCNVQRTGKNLIPNNYSSRTINGVTFSVNNDGSISVSGTPTGNATFPMTFDVNADLGLVVLNGIDYATNIRWDTVTLLTANRETIVTFGQTDDKERIIDLSQYPTVARMSVIFKRKTNDEEVSGTVYPMLRKQSESAEWEPYIGTTYPITFPSEAGTVYGGNLTIHADGTGELVVDRVTIDADIYTGWVRADVGGNEDRFDRSFSYLQWPFPKVQSNETCSHLKRVNTLSNSFGSFIISQAGQSRFLVFHNNDHHFANVEAFNAYLAEEKAKGTPVQISYDIATPVTYQLTPQEIRTLLGVNNIWADTGDINLLKYPVDTSIRVENVDKRITSVLSAMVAPVLTDMIADTALAVNQFRIVNDTLYKVTATIASGGMLTPGTNVIATSIGEQITALLNA